MHTHAHTHTCTQGIVTRQPRLLAMANTALELRMKELQSMAGCVMGVHGRVCYCVCLCVGVKEMHP